jgi:hypothetical protein
MKIPKNKPVENSRVVLERAESLARRPLSADERSTIGTEFNPSRRASKALAGDFVNPIAIPLSVRPGQVADPRPLSKLFKATKEDLETLDRISDAMGIALKESYNAVATKENDLIGELKTLRDKISSLKLYARDITDDDQYVAYTFTDGTEIGQAEGTQATYVEAEGAIVLPVLSTSVQTIRDIAIQEGSNGAPGNNFERDRARNGSVNQITDGAAQTWFEYERVTDRREGQLKLILKLTLEEPAVINRIRVVPANLGTSNWVEIEDIEIETERGVVSIKSDIASASWDESENPFKLSPAAAKFAGEGLYTFAPRMARAVTVTLIQDEPYNILNGAKVRYAIALREVELMQVEFGSEGEFALAPARFPRPATSLGFIQSISPADPRLSKAQFSVSTDGGATWKEVSPLDNKDSAKTEALILETPTQDVMVRGKLERISEGFQRAIDQGEDVLLERSLVVTGGAVTSGITLEAQPETYLEVIETRYGAQGDYGNKLFLGRSSGGLGASQVFELPIVFDKDDLSILVNGEEWSRVVSFASETEKGFLYDQTGDQPRIVLGDGIDPVLPSTGLGGAVPQAGSEIYLKVAKLENPNISAIEGGHKLWLKYESSKVKDSTRVMFRDLTLKQNTLKAGPGANYIDIPWEHTNITKTALSTPEFDYILNGFEDVFQNGQLEFEGLGVGRFSIDFDNNRLWLSEAIPNVGGDLTFTYTHTTRKIIPTSDWKFSDREAAIEVRSDLAVAKTSHKIVAATPGRTLDLDGVSLEAKPFSIVRGSIKGIDLGGTIGISKTLETEITFINGAAEFQKIRSSVGSLLGYFSVDYEDNVLHLPPTDGIAAADQGFLPGRIQFSYISFELHYDLGRVLKEGADYTTEGNAIETTAFFADRVSGLSRRIKRGIDLHVRYNIIDTGEIDGTLVERFYTPVLRDLAIIGIGLDPRLGTLESL